MRPALRALAEQQIILDSQGEALAALAKAAGFNLSPYVEKAHRRVAALNRTADADNPSQPIESEPADPPAPEMTTEVASTPQATTDVTSTEGPVATEDVPPDANTSVTETGGPVLDEALDLNEEDVTAPVQGTDEVGANKVETEVTTGTPSESGPMFPLQGDFAQKQKVQGSSEGRTFAAMRLAGLRMQAGVAPEQDPVLLGQAIASDASLSEEALQAEIGTLTKVVQASVSDEPRRAVSRSLVPRRAAANGERAVPSLASAEPSGPGNVVVGAGVSDDEVLW